MRLPTARQSRTLLSALVLSSVAALLATSLMSRRREVPAADTRTQAPGKSAREIYGRIPLSFEANRGQTEASVNFLARGAGYALFLKPTEAVFILKTNPQSKVLRMTLVGAGAAAEAGGEEELAGKANYLLGDDPSGWRTDVPTYGRVRYAEVYPGVDVTYYGNQRQLEYDFVVAPGRDPSAVSLRFEGADKVDVDANGDLLVKLGESTVRQPKPFVYQEVAGARREVEGAYAVAPDGLVGFRVGKYDPAHALVIDPTLVYSTYLGGGDGDQGRAIAVDSAGNAYVAGFSASTNFPTRNPVQGMNAGSEDAFVTKLNAAGTAVVYSTYFGGGGIDHAHGIAVDSQGAAYVTGYTNSSNFPTANALQATKGTNGSDAFVAKLNAAGTAFVYSTYLGGSDLDLGHAIAVDSAGSAYVAGSTSSLDFPTANALQAAHVGTTTDGFLTKLNAAGSALVYSTYLGGGSNDNCYGVAVDSSGNAYVTGSTGSSNFPLANAIQATPGGGASDAFAAKVNAAGTALVYSTLLGGSGLDEGLGVGVDSSGNAVVAGITVSTNFPTAHAFQPAKNVVNGPDSFTTDGFITKLNAAGTAFVYSTYLGGNGEEFLYGLAVDPAGNAYVTGGTNSTVSFPTANAIQCTRSGLSDAFVSKLNAAGSALAFSTYLGGTGFGAAGRAVAVDSSGDAYVAGDTRGDFPTVGAVQSAFGGETPNAQGDAFVAKIGDTSLTPTSAFSFGQTTYTADEDVAAVNLVVRRTGDLSGAATVDYTTADGTASERSDYTTARGTLRFAAGQSEATLPVLINEDSLTTPGLPISFNVLLSNPTSRAALSCPAGTALVQITDDATEPAANAIDDAAVFVGTHYHDFLNRQADTTGLNFWANQITACGADDTCLDRRRTAVSTAFFLSIEFQQTGFLVHRFYKASFTDSPARPRGLARYHEFLRDTQEIGRGVVVGAAGWEQVLEANKREFALRWVQRPDFLAEFPESMSFDDYVAKLAANSGTTLTPTEVNIAFESYSNTAQGRANALRAVLESASVYNAQFNAGFVLAQYIGYLRRNPNDAPDTDYTGFDFWLAKLDGFSQPGENVQNEQTAIARVNRAEMVRAFIRSTEYRRRFGQP